VYPLDHSQNLECARLNPPDPRIPRAAIRPQHYGALTPASEPYDNGVHRPRYGVGSVSIATTRPVIRALDHAWIPFGAPR